MSHMLLKVYYDNFMLPIHAVSSKVMNRDIFIKQPTKVLPNEYSHTKTFGLIEEEFDWILLDFS